MGAERKTPAGKTAYWESRKAVQIGTVDRETAKLATVDARIAQLELDRRERVAEGKKVGQIDGWLAAAHDRRRDQQTRLDQARDALGEAEAELAALREGHPFSSSATVG